MKKLTISELTFYKMTHPHTTLQRIGSVYRVSPQYVHELWNKHYPSKKFNEAWGASIQKTCKTCGKIRWVKVKEVERGGGIYCNIECKYFKKYLKIR